MSILKEMMEAGVHFGHQTRYWNPAMAPFIYGERNKIHIINLDKTVVMLKQALDFAKNVVKNNGKILFVGTRMQAGPIVMQQAQLAQMPYVAKRWLGGMLTNFDTVRKSVKKLEQKRAMLEKSVESGLSKKEILHLTREVEKLNNVIGGIATMNELPQAVFVIDTGYHDIAIKECKKLGIPVIGVLDTNNNPSSIDYVIPGNDDSTKAINLYLAKFVEVITATKEEALSDLAAIATVEMADSKLASKDGKEHVAKRVKKIDNIADLPN